MSRRVLGIIIGIMAVLAIGGTASAQSENTGLSAQDIATISQSVVYIEAYRGTAPYASGSGTIIDSSGLIYTNHHVIEGATDYLIYLTREIGELPEPVGFASVVQDFYLAGDIDFAILQIDRDPDGNRIDPFSLELPALQNAARETSLGERIWVFGYPGVGDGYLVVTQGSITSVENANIFGQRVPAWYRTDAEISPGNSGGLVVNGRGEFLGIPTMVRSEEETLGRLGGVLPFIAVETVLSAFESGAVAVATPQPFNPALTDLSIKVSRVEYDVADSSGGQLGVKIHTEIGANGYLGRDIRAAIFLLNEDGSPVDCGNMAEEYCAPDGGITVQTVLTPSFEDSIWEDYWFWIPYDGFPDGLEGVVNFSVQGYIGLDGQQTLQNASEPAKLVIDFGSGSVDVTTNPDGAGATFDVTITRMAFDMTGDHSTDLGIRAYVNMTAVGARGQPVRIALFFYDANGELMKCNPNYDSYYCLTNGNLTVQEVVTPTFDSSEWTDYWMHVPYDAFPSGLSGVVPVEVVAMVDLDGGESFNFRSVPFRFELYY